MKGNTQSLLNGNRWLREWERRRRAERERYMANKQEGVTREGLLWNKSLLLSSPLRLSAYPLSHQSVRPLRHLSPAAFLRPVNRSHSSADRLMRLHKLRAPHTPDQRGRRRYTRGGGVTEVGGRTEGGRVQ